MLVEWMLVTEIGDIDMGIKEHADKEKLFGIYASLLKTHMTVYDKDTYFIPFGLCEL